MRYVFSLLVLLILLSVTPAWAQAPVPANFFAFPAGTTSISFRLNWTNGNETSWPNATTQVEGCVGQGCTNFTLMHEWDNIYVSSGNEANKSVSTLTGLTTKTVYRFRARSFDSVGGTSAYSPFVITTSTTGTPDVGCGEVQTYTSTYGYQVKQLNSYAYQRGDYHYRNPWNADNTYLIVVHHSADTLAAAISLHLYTADGCYIRELINPTGAFWAFTWSTTDRNIFYYNDNNNIYAYNVSDDTIRNIKSYPTSPTSAKINVHTWPTINGTGTRLGFLTGSDNIVGPTTGFAWRSYRINGTGNGITLDDERIVDYDDFTDQGINFDSCGDNRNTRYINNGDHFIMDCRAPGGPPDGLIVDDANPTTVVGTIPGGLGHDDCSPAGVCVKYFDPGEGNFGDNQFHLMSFPITFSGLANQGTELWTLTSNQVNAADTKHVTCPRNNVTWCVIGWVAIQNIYRDVQPVDDVMLVNLSTGARTPISKSGTADPSNATQFWAQTHASPSADGSRILNNTNCRWINGGNDYGGPTPYGPAPGCLLAHGGNDVAITYTGEAPPNSPNSLILGASITGGTTH